MPSTERAAEFSSLLDRSSPLETAPNSAELQEITHRAILEAAGEGIYGLDALGRTTFANPATEAMTGWRAEELIGKPQHAMVHHSYRDGTPYPRELCPIYAALRDGRVHRSETEVFWRKDGTSFEVAYTSTPILRDGRPDGAVVTFSDISKRKRGEAWEKSKNAVFLSITGHREISETLGQIVQCYARIYPDRPLALFTCSGESLALAAGNGLPQELEKTLLRVALREQDSLCARAAERAGELRVHAGKTERAWRELSWPSLVECLALPLISGSGDVLGVVASFATAAQAKEKPDGEQGPHRSAGMRALREVCNLARLAMEHNALHMELLRQSQYDHLTGLPNRQLLEDRLERAIVQAKRHATQIAVCYVDLDDFKQINDKLGHMVGDSVLREVGKLLRANLKDLDTVARQSGDEFILILPEIHSSEEADRVCERVLGVLRQPLHVGPHTFRPTVSVGRSLYPGDGRTATALLQHADIAVYAAKNAGGNRVQTFSESLGQRVQRELEIQRELRCALERKQFHLMYQPLWDAQKHLRGFEALLRWTHPTLGFISPAEFIPPAERSGLIVGIGEWVVHEACRQVQEWNALAGRPISVFVNVSGVQLSGPNFLETVAGALKSSGIRPNLLNLEITETCIVADPEAASQTLKQIRGLGARIAIDDFGIGHSSFSYLQKLPVDVLKVDQSFVACLDGTDKQSAILRSILALAKEMGLETVAEGIETHPQFEEIRTTPCKLFQGYLLARPLSVEAARALVLELVAAPMQVSA